MINVHTTFSHNFLKISIGNSVAHVKEHRVQNDAFGEMDVFEIERHPHPPHSIINNDYHITQQK